MLWLKKLFLKSASQENAFKPHELMRKAPNAMVTNMQSAQWDVLLRCKPVVRANLLQQVTRGPVPKQRSNQCRDWQKKHHQQNQEAQRDDQEKESWRSKS